VRDRIYGASSSRIAFAESWIANANRRIIEEAWCHARFVWTAPGVPFSRSDNTSLDGTGFEA